MESMEISPAEIEAVLDLGPQDVELPARLTYSKNVFVPLTTACRYTCTYCEYFDSPGKATILSPTEVRNILEQGVRAGCSEALFTFGDEPDDRYTSLYEELQELGHDSIHSYLREMCGLALDVGLLPHSNPGDQTHAQLRANKTVNASMGVMLETTADVDAHSGPRHKSPSQRINTIRMAGKLKIPFTTGILIGIGEDWRDRAESLLVIKQLHEEYGHIQEVIVQNVVPNARSTYEQPSIETMRRVTAMARATLPQEVSVQVPPNLSPTEHLLDCGVDDLGGVSPVTDDYINPDYPWPEIDRLEKLAEKIDVPLVERLPIHDRYLPPDLETPNTWIEPPIRNLLTSGETTTERYHHILERLRN